MAPNTQQSFMDTMSAQDQLCALASQFTSLAGLGDHSDPELQRHLAIRITDVIKEELVQRGAIQPDHPPTIWEGGLRLDPLEQSANNTLKSATTEDEDVAMRNEAMPDRMETDEEDMDTSENADQTYVVGLSQEVLAVKLHKRFPSDNRIKTVDPQFKATLPMVERLGPLMVKALTTYWDEELRQAEAAPTATSARQAPQTLALTEYCRQPQTLAEKDNANDFEGAVKSIQDIVQDQRNATHARQGMKSWVWPLLQKYYLDTDESKEVKIGNEELLYMALGEKFPEAMERTSLNKELSSRAFSRAKGDYSGRRETRLFKNVPQIGRDEWNDHRVVWKHFAELVAFNWDMKRQPFIELPSMEMTLKYGYRGFRDDNYSWSITIRDDENGDPCAFSTVPIKSGSFLGFLPGYCRFNPEKENRMELKGFIESHLLGLFFEDQGSCGLLSYMKRTNLSAEGNVIGGWEQYNDDMGQDSMPWCIVVFAYRDIPALTPLVFWDHMRFD